MCEVCGVFGVTYVRYGVSGECYVWCNGRVGVWGYGGVKGVRVYSKRLHWSGEIITKVSSGCIVVCGRWG